MAGYTTRLAPRMLKQTPLTLKRESLGQYVNGRYVKGLVEDVPILASVQPVTRSTDLQMLPEGDRSKAAVEVWSSSLIMGVKEGGQGYPADKFEWLGEWFEVMKVMPWQMGHIDHYHALARRMTSS